MARREIFDAHGGVVKTIEYDSSEKRIVLGYHHDTTAITDRNKRLASEDPYTSPDRWRRRVASVPFGTLFKWLQQDGISQLRYMRWSKHERNEWLRKKIYDPDNWFVLTASHKTHVNPHLIVR